MARPDYIDLIGLKGKTFKIPSQQRGYKWTPLDIRHLLDDLLEFAKDTSSAKIYCLQPLALAKIDDTHYEALDGQQRLTTLYLINKAFNGSEAYTFIFDRDTNNQRVSFLRCCDEYLTDDKINRLPIDEYHIYKAYQAVLKWKDINKTGIDSVKKLINGEIPNKSAKFIWYIIEGQAEDETTKHKAFRNLNDGKIELTNTDLIKALLLNDDNESSNYNVSLIAAQFEEIEQKLKDDSFWFMFQNDEPLYRNCRMDLLFNIAESISKEEYDRNNTASFEKFSETKDPEKLLAKWENVRNIFIRLLDFYNDIETYHYIGYLAYCNSSSKLPEWITTRNSNTRSELVKKLVEKIKDTLCHDSLAKYSYENDSASALRRVFLLHNVETIIENYKVKNQNKDLNLKYTYERFPFELLYRQIWQIEHISSQTDNILQDLQSQNDWIESSKSDFPDVFKEKDILELVDTFNKMKTSSKDERIASFKALYQAVLQKIDNMLAENKISDKDEIGNLVLLDSKTNQGYHNALFPAKRRWVIKHDQQFFYPPCTHNVFTKFYNTRSKIMTWAWTKEDRDSYYADMEYKLEKFFN